MAKFDKSRVVRQPLGRPTAYRPEYAQQLIDYFETAFDLSPPQEGEVRPPAVFPTLARFATYCGVTQNTLRNWADAKEIDDSPLYPEFFRAYYTVKEYQEAILSEGYTSGVFGNTAFGVLIAKNILAWKDKTEQEVTGTTNVNVQATVAVSGLADKLAKVKGKADPA